MTQPQTVSDSAGKNLAVITGGKATSAFEKKPIPKGTVTKDDFGAQMEKALVNGAKAKANSDEDEKKKQAVLDQKNEDEKRKLLLEAEEQGKKANSLAESVVKLSQELIRIQFAFKKAGPQEQEKLKNEALAIGVRCLENIEAALSPLKSAKTGLLGRLKGTFEWESPDIHALIKERKKPREQFELDLGLQRSKMDLMHRTCEENGAPRVTREPKAKSQEKDAA